MINQNWVFGYGAGLDFSGTTPGVTSGFGMTTKEGCASISDVNGNLLFYTDGSEIWDATHVSQINGLDGNNSSTQSAIIIPNRSNINEYFIFTADGSSGNNKHITGIRVDITNWSYTNFVIDSNLETNFSPTEKITAVADCDCDSFWVITVVQRSLSNGTAQGRGTIRIFKVNDSGLTHINDYDLSVDVADIGYLKVSPNGKKIAFANWQLSKVLTFDFDNCTGIVDISTLQTINAPDKLPLSLTNSDENLNHKKWIYGLEFSPNNEFLYYSILGDNPTVSRGRGYIYQVDLSTAAQTLIGTHDNTNGVSYAIGALQLGPNGVIYIAQSGEPNLAAINSPDSVGLACDLVWDQITLDNGTTAYLGLPNLLPNPCPTDSDCDCGCGCSGCNENADELNAELIERAKEKHNIESSGNTPPFQTNCDVSAVRGNVGLKPDFHFHWGDGPRDQFEEHDTEIFYLTVCNRYDDVQFNGLQITKLNLVPDVEDLDKIQIVPDRFVHFDCLTPCACQTREFALITRANDIAGSYKLEIEYCYSDISIIRDENSGTVSFPVEIIKD